MNGGAPASGACEGSRPVGTELHPGQTVLDIVATIDDRSRRVPVLLPESATPKRTFTTAIGGTSFSLTPGATPRLTQLGNQTSSKLLQDSYALRFDAPGKLRITVSSRDGRYGAGCFLCLQIYGSKRDLITQARIPLSAAGVAQNVEIPASAATGCFSVQLAGDGLAASINVDIAPHGLRAKARAALVDGVFSSDELRALIRTRDEDGLRRVFTDQQSLVIACVRHWYRAGDYHDIARLLEFARAWTPAKPIERVLAPLIYYAARGLSNLNATRTAKTTLDQLWDIGAWRSHLEAKEIRGAHILDGHVCFKNGETAKGLQALDRARLADPTHWEAYYLLAGALGDDQASLRDAYLAGSQALRATPHRKLTVAVVENHLARGRWGEALAAALAATSSLADHHDVWLCLANVYLETGDATSWRSFVGRYFEQFGLSSPHFDDASSNGTRYGRIGSLPPAAARSGKGTVAIVMTTFNSEATVEPAIRSTLNQTYGDIVVAVVDDGSADRTNEIVERLAKTDRRIRRFKSEVNSGTYFCKNLALSAIDADYFTFHDSDDWMHPERIARHIAEMEATQAVCTTSIWLRMAEDGRVTIRHSGGYQHANPASIFVRREVLQRAGYFDCVRTGADTEYVWRLRSLYGRSRVREIQVPLGIGLQHGASLTQSGVTAFNRHRYSQVRLEYWESWVRWHYETLGADQAALCLPFPMEQRKYWAPPAITPDGGRRD